MELILNTFGVSLSKDNGCFMINSADVKQRIPVQGIKSIQISRGAQITSDAVLLAIENEIEIIFMDNQGKPMGRVWSNKYGSISTIRKGQIEFTFSSKALEWIKNVIAQKIANQQALLMMMPTNDDEVIITKRKKAINRLEDYRAKVLALEGEIVSDVAPTLRGWEGVASKIYFETIQMFLPDEFKFKERSQVPAMDVANAFLNYGYGILYGKVEGALIKAGIDPYVGVLHRDDYNRPVLVYDVIEIYRVWVDYVVWNILCQKVVNEDFYSVKEDKSFWLEALGRRILIQSFNDYLEEIITVKGVQRSRSTQILLYCQNLAQMFKDFSEK
ncbi:MAG: CRISPR-associated endonuclease Cas1 [Bacteroidales bacterium]|nr:CRISPR-associated endonuclease Cas1 [Bacteroidales bacterium]